MYTWTYPYESNHNPSIFAALAAWGETQWLRSNRARAMENASRPS
jgi:hypothetical protein